MPQFLATTDPDFEPRFATLLAQKREADADVDADVAAILAEVAARGDAALIELTERFDRLRLTPATLAFSEAEIDAAVAAVEPEDRAALELAADAHPRLPRAPAARGRALDRRRPAPSSAGAGRRSAPAGLYVPGGLASYPSSVLMNAIPARVAGVERLVICAPTPDGAVNPLVLLAARLAGVATVYRDRRRAGDRRARLRHRDDRAGRQDHRPRQRLGRRRQAPGVRPRRHRHDRRPVRGAGPRRRRQRPRLAGARPDGAGRARRQRPVDPRHRRRRASAAPSPPRSTARLATLAAPRRSPAPAGATSARSSPSATGTRRSRSSTGSRPSTCRSAPPTPRRWPRGSATPARSSSAPGRPRRSATTSAARTTCCRPPARRASPPASRCSTS